MIEIRTQTPLKLPKEFLVNEEFFTPDPAEDLYVELRDVSGATLGSRIYLDLAEPDWLVPASNFSLAVDELSKFLFMEVTFITDGQQITWSSPVRVVRFKPITVTPLQVRNLLGASNEELPDSVFDVYAGYLEVSEILNADLFSDVTKVVHANKALLLHVAITQIPTLPLRLLKTREVDDHKMTRQSIDYLTLQGELYAQFRSLLVNHFNYVPVAEYAQLLTVVSVTDPLTGE